MKLESLIAVRYLFARGQKSVVHAISWISLGGLLVSTAALIIVLSVYNGIGELTKSLFNTFDPELIIEPAEGKTLYAGDIDLSNVDGVECVSQIVSEAAWITYGEQQAIVTLRGVDSNYAAITGIDTLLNDGEYLYNTNSQFTIHNSQFTINGLVVGGDIYYRLAMRLHSNMPAVLHIPKRGTTSMGFTIDDAFNVAYTYPVGNFFIQQDLDSRYVLCDAQLVRQLMNYAPDECTALALKLTPGSNPKKVKKEIIESQFTIHNSQITVKDRYDQQPLYFKIFRSERLGIYMILSLIVLISTLSLVSSLSLLIISKRRDIFVLRSMGMRDVQLRRAFFAEGMLICLAAVVSGLIIGFTVCWLQQHFGIIRMGDGNFVVSAFPVAMRAVDFLYTFLLVMTLSSLSVALTVTRRL
ncbi:MAG: ABC transporter permease [Bacteroidales bacterium]|nr:ABC transporter permease [Bacteroidales bacterium]